MSLVSIVAISIIIFIEIYCIIERICTCVENSVKYKFYYMRALIINDIEYEINNDMVVITLYLDEFIVEIYDNKEKLQQSLTLPYNAIEEVYILLED